MREPNLDRKNFLLKALDRIESKESVLLYWGLVDSFLTRDELNEILNPLIDEALENGYEEFTSSDEVFTALHDLKLITLVETSTNPCAIRSRMAETVRLMFRLRQLFPKHDKLPGLWKSAPTLVSDFRFQRRKRVYPIRNISKEEVLSKLRETTSNSAVIDAADALMTSKGEGFKFSGFQVRSAQRILRGIESGQGLGTIVCAGTGSGKTLAFFLPVLAYVASQLMSKKSQHHWVKVVAIYPRTELLKDQLKEAVKNSISLCKNLSHGSEIAIRVGALYGSTPFNANSWKKQAQKNHEIYPSLSCIQCGKPLKWVKQYYESGKERLVCSNCKFELDDCFFPLTRKSLIETPPDILFTTTEMLNQRLADSETNHLFGVGPRSIRSPAVALLDEVHSYEGMTGAQVSYLMRRWQHMLDDQLSFVGLSATLTDAQYFFSDLTGMKLSNTQEIKADSDEIQAEGAEYLVALKGDPVSRKALLSTTIQTIMLVERCLDPPYRDIPKSVSQGIFGCRTFVFTDNLDVTNRLYFDVLDSEGRDSSGDPIPSRRNGGWASLRKKQESLPRYFDGQDWRLCQFLGHNLDERYVVERVSSQDTGVDSSSHIVIATSALEVGFDDPFVGAVVQHKAPRSASSFLQRKGRAGRLRGMRPWTIVILSDYGRDRLAYQSYDQMLDPELPRPRLPLANRFIQRIQSVFATIDFLGIRMADVRPRGSVWQDLSEPSDDRNRTDRLQKELRTLLETDKGCRTFQTYVKESLGLNEEDVSALLWEYPRPLMTVVLPTALRRIETKWSSNGEVAKDYLVRNNPLPEFAPGTLFSDLNLNEVAIVLPDSKNSGSNSFDSMPVLNAIREFAPGRVSRRFGIKTKNERYWIGPEEEFFHSERYDTPYQLDIDKIGDYSDLGEFQYKTLGTVASIRVFCPRKWKPSAPPSTVEDSSNANNIWKTQIVSMGEPNWLIPPIDTLGHDLFDRLGFFTHSDHAPVEARRFTLKSSAELVLGKPSRTIKTEIEYFKESSRVALGFSQSVDGMVFMIKQPESLMELVQSFSHKTIRSLRTSRFFDHAWTGVELSEIDNPFQRDWLAQIYLSALTYTAIEQKKDLADASEEIRTGKSIIRLTDILDVLFQSNDIELATNDQAKSDRLRQDLNELIKNPTTVERLHCLSKVLWEPISDGWKEWLLGVYQATLGATILKSVCDLCPKIDPETLTVDLDRGPTNCGDLNHDKLTNMEVWITENSPGGNGLIEDFLKNYSEDPRKFFSIVRTNLRMGDLELIDHQLAKLLDLLQENASTSNIPESVKKFRSASNHSEIEQSQRDLRLSLARERFSPFHGFMVSVWNRILRPKSSSKTDNFLANSLSIWRKEEERLGIEIDLRIISYWLSLTNEIDAIVNELVDSYCNMDRTWRMNAISGILWARGRNIRQATLRLNSMFGETPPTERLLLEESIVDQSNRISVQTDDWMEKAFDHLSNGRMVTLTCNESGRNLLANCLNLLITNPVHMEYLKAYARLQGIRFLTDVVEADIELVEALQ